MKSFPAFLALPFCVCSFSSQAAPDPCISELKIIQHSLEAEGGWHGPIANDPNDNGWLRWIEIIPGIHKDKNNRVVCKAIGTYYGDYYPGGPDGTDPDYPGCQWYPGQLNDTFSYY